MDKQTEEYPNLHQLASALGIAVQAGYLSRDDAKIALKEKLYVMGLLKRFEVVKNPKEATKTKVTS